MNTAIIGAGPAGLTAAYALAKSTPKVHVFEASNCIGGMARSFPLWGQTVDLGPHRFFSQNKRVNELWLEVVGQDYAMVKRKTRVLYKDQFFSYPLNPADVFPRLGLLETVRCGASYLLQKCRATQDDDSFEAWVTSRFGKRLYEIFFRPYSEKLWGIPCSELDVDFAAQRIRKFSLGEAFKNAIGLGANSKHRTLVDEFAYPLEGTGMVYQRMAQAVEERGGAIHLEEPIKRVVVEEEEVKGIELKDGEFRPYDTVVSSMPLTALVRGLTNVPEDIRRLCSELQFRNTILVYLEVDSDSVCDDNWIYVQDPALRTGRITNFRNWVPQLYGDRSSSILALEYWCNDTDSTWAMLDEQLIELAKNDLVETKLIDSVQRIQQGAVFRVPKCYPVYRRGYKEVLKPIQEYLSRIDGLHVIGRYGSFKYNNQDHSILMGLLIADILLSDSRHDLWEVNCDYDNYQEAACITATGLTALN